jgi:peptidoglycan/LPS O-acetylase OafA/YrhL
MEVTKYRSDIDGLRAIAVLLVVIFHAGFSFIPGGYVGVDVFFVISGFLITGILKKEILSGTFEFKKFYQRRIRRLMPALFVMLIITTLISVIVLLPSDLASYGKSLISVVLSLSNIYFWRENGGYFDSNVEEVPLLHTWSLSVEEQFYLLWPVFLLVFSKYLQDIIFLITLIAMAVTSVFLSQWVSDITFGAAYYLLPTRAFELLIGAILAIAGTRLPSFSGLVMNILAGIGLVLILASAVLLNGDSSFPGFNALYPTIGTALLLFTGRQSGVYVNRLLSLYPLVWMGLISYSLYLWHWPIVVFIRYTGFELSTITSSCIVILSILMGWLSYKYIETPFRSVGTWNFKETCNRLYILPSIMIIVIGSGIYIQDGIPQRFDSMLIDMEHAVTSKPGVLREGCHSPSRLSEVRPSDKCWQGDQINQEKTALLIGDSHGNHFSGFMDEIAKSSKLGVIDYTMDECLPIFDLPWGHNQYYSEICKNRNDISQSYIKNNTFDYVILAGYWPSDEGYHYIFDDNKKRIKKTDYVSYLETRLAGTLSKIIESGATPVLIKDSAPSGHPSPTCSIKKHLFNNALNCNVKKQLVDKRDKMVNDLFIRLEERYSDLIIIDPKDVMCDEQYCFSSLNGIPLFLDKNHLNDEGSRALGRQYLELSGNPFL